MDQKIVDNLRSLLESKDEKNIGVAINMMANLEPHPTLFTHIYFYYYATENTYADELEQLLREKYSEEDEKVKGYDIEWLSDIVNYGGTESDFIALDKLPKDSPLDKTTLCKLALIHCTMGGAYAWKHNSLPINYIIEMNTNSDGFLKLCNYNLDHFPLEILEYSHIKKLDLTDNAIKSIPKEIGKLSNLRDIFLDFEKIEPESITILEEQLPIIMAKKYYDEGVDLFYDEAYEKALEKAKKSLFLNSEDMMVMNLVCGCYDRLGDTKAAIQFLEDALPKDPHHILILSNLSILYHKIGDGEKALEIADKGIESYNTVGSGAGLRDHATLYFNKGQALFFLDRLEESLEVYNYSLRVKPGDGGSLYNIACIYARWKDKEKVFYNLKEAIKDDSKYKEQAPKDTDFEEYWEDEEFIELCAEEEEDFAN